MSEQIELADCEVIMTAFKKTNKGMQLTFLVQPEDITPTLQLMPLNEPMRMKLSNEDVGA